MVETVRGHLVFACGGSLYAVPSELASEVVSLPALTRVPGAPAHLLGVFAHRGEVVPVIDVAQLTGVTVEGDYRRAVLVRSSKGVVALTATRVTGVAPLSGEFAPLGETGVHQHLRGPARVPAGEVALIEPEGFLDYLSGVG